MDRSQSKYFNTARLMDQALLLLLGKKDYAFITVKEVCEKAGVNRSTFYLHYGSMDDLLLESIEYITGQMRNRFHENRALNKERIRNATLDELVFITPQYLLPYLEFVKDNKKVFLAAASQPVAFRTQQIFNTLYDHIFSPILSRYDVSEQDKKYMLAFYLNGIYAVITVWIQNGCKDEISHIIKLIIAFVQPYKAGPRS